MTGEKFMELHYQKQEERIMNNIQNGNIEDLKWIAAELLGMIVSQNKRILDLERKINR